MVVWVQVPLAVRYGQTDAYRSCPFYLESPPAIHREKHTHYAPKHNNKSDLFRLTAGNMLRMGYAKEDDKLAYLIGLYEGYSFSTLLEINSMRKEITRKR